MAEIAQTKERAERDISEVDFRVRAAHESKKADASRRLKDLMGEYDAEVSGKWGGLLLLGPRSLQEAFAQRAEEAGPAVAVDIQPFWERLTSAVTPTMRRDRMWEPDQFSALLFAFAEVSREMDVQNMASLTYQGSVAVPDHQSLLGKVRDTVRQADKDETTALFVRVEALKEAIKVRYSRSILPVVVMGATSDELPRLQALFSGRAVTVDLSDLTSSEVPDEIVREAFENLKRLYKSKTDNV